MTSRSPVLLGAVALAAVLARPRLRNCGATPDDRRRFLPGDRLVAGERGVCTMAIDIAAPPAAVWPWLAQMGTDRAGWYSWDHLDNGGRPSARAINPAWTGVREGDRLVSVPDRAWFDVAHAEPGRSLVLRAALDLPGRPYDPTGPRPYGFVDARWEFFLEPLGDGATRLLVRSGSASGPRWPTDVLDLALVHPAHVVMQIRQLHQLRARAGSPSPPRSQGAACPPASTCSRRSRTSNGAGGSPQSGCGNAPMVGGPRSAKVKASLPHHWRVQCLVRFAWPASSPASSSSPSASAPSSSASAAVMR